LNDEFHLYELEWTEDNIITRFDGDVVLNINIADDQTFWDRYNFAGSDDPWAGTSNKNAPFD
jgi:hypothetical protein